MHVPFKPNSLFPFTTDFFERTVNMLNDTISCIHSSTKHNVISESTIPLKLPWLLVNSGNFLQIEKDLLHLLIQQYLLRTLLT